MIRFVLKLYIYIIIADAILSYFPNLSRHVAVKRIKLIAEFSLKPIRRLLPKDMPFDVSPIIVILGLNILMAMW